MGYSYRIFRVFGISVELHITFVFFLLLISLLGMLNASFWPVAVFLLSIFAVVLMHELVHSLTAIGFGIRVPRITLTPIGGLASIEVPEDPKKELLISIAGPMSNFAFAAIVFTYFVATNTQIIPYGIVLDNLYGGSAELADPSILLSGILWVNILLGAFNVIPGFPMDGGRIFRAVLALWIDYLDATKIAVHLGQLVSILMVFIGLFSNPWLLFIGLFLYYAGNSEYQMVKLKHALRGLRVGDIAAKEMVMVSEQTILSTFLTSMIKQTQTYYPIVDATGRISGILDIRDIKKVRKEDLALLPVKNIAERRFEVVDSNAKVEELLVKLLNTDFAIVAETGKVIGYLTPEKLFDAAQFRSLLK